MLFLWIWQQALIFVHEAQQFLSGTCKGAYKGRIYGENVNLYGNFEEGTTAKAQGTMAIDPSHEICKLHIARAH